MQTKKIDCIEFGGGETPRRPDFMQVDVRSVETVDIVSNAWEIDRHVMSNTISEIYSRHFLEHLTFAQAALTLKVWHGILKPGGIVVTTVPNMDWHVALWMQRTKDQTVFERAIEGFWGKQRDGLTETWDVHKSGYDAMMLERMYANAGFTDIHQIDDLPKNLTMEAKKAK